VGLNGMDHDAKFIGREDRDTEVGIRVVDGSNCMDVSEGQGVDMLFIFVHSIRVVEEVVLFNNFPELLAIEFVLISKFNVKLSAPLLYSSARVARMSSWLKTSFPLMHTMWTWKILLLVVFLLPQILEMLPPSETVLTKP
jgi:hypothetical protein